jgi:hypothetical protein
MPFQFVGAGQKMRSIVLKTYNPAIPIVGLGVLANGMRGTSPRMTLEQEDGK